nr:unnamed protein product [Digitaria exilis]
MVRCKGQDSRLAEEQHGLRKIITRSHNLLTQPNIRRKIATDIRDIKSRVMEVHERRQRYEVNNNQVHLRCLGLRSTNIVELPEEIGNLQELQMLDISNNAVPALPFTIVRLRQQLKSLYIGGRDMMSSLTPSGIRHLTFLEELSSLYIEDSVAKIEEMGCLTGLRVLDVACIILSTVRGELLVQSLNKLQNVQNLSIRLYGVSGPLKGLTGPPSLRSLKVTRYMFPKLPAWINPSHVENLSLLEIEVHELQPEDLKTLGKFPVLRYLHMCLDKRRRSDAPAREFVVCACSFPCLLRCRLEGDYGRVVFQQGAMPSLTSLELHIYSTVWRAWEATGIPDWGFENLSSLLDLYVGLREGDCSGSGSEEARAALRNMAEIHSNHPSISAPGYRS